MFTNICFFGCPFILYVGAYMKGLNLATNNGVSIWDDEEAKAGVFASFSGDSGSLGFSGAFLEGVSIRI